MFDFVRYLKEQYKFDYNFKKLTIYGMDDDIAKIITDNGVMYPKYKDGNLSYSLTSKMFKLTPIKKVYILSSSRSFTSFC